MFYGKSRGQRRKFKSLLKYIDKIEGYKDTDEINKWGFEHFHVPCPGWLDMPRTSSKIKTTFCKAWVKKTEEILKAKPGDLEFCKVVCCLCVPHYRDSQIIIFYNKKYYDSFFTRHNEYQDWTVITDGRSFMNERHIVTDLKETGFIETMYDEDHTVKRDLWFYGEL